MGRFVVSLCTGALLHSRPASAGNSEPCFSFAVQLALFGSRVLKYTEVYDRGWLSVRSRFNSRYRIKWTLCILPIYLRTRMEFARTSLDSQCRTEVSLKSGAALQKWTLMTWWKTCMSSPVSIHISYSVQKTHKFSLTVCSWWVRRPILVNW